MHHYSGSGKSFQTEPKEWFKNKKHILIFTHKDPNLTLHSKSNICKLQFPHKTNQCNYLK